ncbi:Cholinesterase,Putative inactive carboxylesterase 4,Juvenile hormone esterase [Mytilus coruscus]|uniref:Carboxylic ester hydrolase n=1 Tax=Mytilus coruscus TaxID=42192 RepID=A0A6J8E963_MYTCO|nr:Cholinesterase,Putative inactive carboxylesterase 4,Juvenile hormone esterase [Mytilus coruscus]
MVHKLTVMSVLVTSVISDDIVTLQTNLGPVKGISSTVSFGNITKAYTVFKKIPYAKPPVGDLRFKDPASYGPWNGTLDATQFGPSCFQPKYPAFENYMPNFKQSEDCLFLNIYVPASSSVRQKKSVMIWIHGGAYIVGQGMLYDGSYLSVVGDIIVVTINYRLNVFGFLTTSDGMSNGNYGFNDQRKAIQWVNDNIESFGGDTQSITLFGESAGGFSVGLQTIFPSNKGLFHRVIEQSGTSNTFFSETPKHFLGSELVIQSLNCSNGMVSERMTCMQSKSEAEILNASLSLPYYGSGSSDLHIVGFWAPYLKDDPRKSMDNPSSPAVEFFKSLDVIIGTCESEGSLLLEPLAALQNKLSFNISDGITSDYMCKHILPPLTEDYYRNNNAIGNAICQKYQNNGSIADQGKHVVNFYSDLFYHSPAVQSLNVHATNRLNRKQFRYVNKRRSVVSYPLNSFPWLKEAGHGAEIPYIFPVKAALPYATDDDISFSLKMMKYWSNFAKTGNVNGNGVPKWPEYDLVTKQYALLDVNPVILNNLYKDRMDFWLTKIPALASQHGTTPCTEPELAPNNGKDGNSDNVDKAQPLIDNFVRTPHRRTVNASDRSPPTPTEALHDKTNGSIGTKKTKA